MPTRDLDTIAGRNAALCDAADELYKLTAGQHVELHRPGYPVARLQVAQPWHESADTLAPSDRYRVTLSYGIASAPLINVRASHLAFSGWLLNPRPA